MKAPATKKHSSNVNSHSSKPFFTKNGEGSFFSQSQETEQPFFSPYSIQPKLTIGQPNDPYEQEANTMAEKVVGQIESSKPNPSIQTRSNDCEQEEKLQKKEEEESEKELMRKPVFAGNGGPPENPIQAKFSTPYIQLSPDLETNLQSSKRKGSPIPENTRQKLESGFATNFENVRIHTDQNTIQMNKELGAQAFTYGADIYFSKGKYNPNSLEGKKLLAHELTHTIQQKKRVQQINSWIQRRIVRVGGRPVRKIDQLHMPNTFPEFRQALIDFIHPLVSTRRREFLIDNCRPRPRALWRVLLSQVGKNVELFARFIWGTNHIDQVNFILPLPSILITPRSPEEEEDNQTQQPQTPTDDTSTPQAQHPQTPDECSPSSARGVVENCTPNPHGAHLPPVGRTHSEVHPLEPCRLTEQEVATSPDWCVDKQQGHGGETCYRQIPTTSGAKGDQYCYSENCCHNSADRVSIVKPSSPGSGTCCENDLPSMPGHIWEDFVPELLDDPERVIRDTLGL